MKYLIFPLLSVFFLFTFSTLYSEILSDSLYYKIKKIENKDLPEFYWDMNNKEFSSKDFSGNIIFINFWATWCPPCVYEMPDLSELNSELKDSGVIMIGISVFYKSGAPKLQNFLSQNPVSYLILEGNDEIVKAFEKAYGEEMDSIPTTFIIDKNGKIVERIIGLRKKEFYKNIIKKYLNN
jgi:cytochrome c biogenesis protein CcmG, thiol:disulfide interchange protein DsbE